jgi:serine protease Do
VRIETVGGLEQVEGVLFGSGPTTGLIVDPSGYVISSAFNFVNKPTSILVRLADGTRKPAKLTATDHSRMLVLLKIEAEKPLPVCEIAPLNGMRVGQWTIAVGKTFENDRPNLAVGILGAVHRIWGKAIQTDAAVSPNNYGGPLVDIHGRVMGVLVPLSPQAAGEIAGMELYDSGIGFAIPAENIQKVLPRLKKGENLYPGLAGISLKGPNPFTSVPIIAACRPKSPAAAAGVKPGDQIVEIEGRPIAREAEVMEELGRRYAGEKIRVTFLRNKERIPREIELAAKLEPFQPGFLGILPNRAAEEDGVTARYVYPNSPAAAAGIAAGDVIVSLEGEPVHNRAELAVRIGSLEPGNEVNLEVRRAGSLRKLQLALAPLPEDLPPKDLPPNKREAKSATAMGTVPSLGGSSTATPTKSNENRDSPPDRPKVGPMPMKVPEFSNEAWAYVPENYDPGVPYGVVIWLHAPGGFDWNELLARWKPLCDRHDLILLAPKSADPARWMPGELDWVDRLLTEIASTYHVDAARVAVHGNEGGGSMAFLAAFRNRDAIRAVAAVEASPMGPPPENDPMHRLAVYIAVSEKSPNAGTVEKAVARMREKRIPVVVKKLGEIPRYLHAEELADLARWIDSLDRI